MLSEKLDCPRGDATAGAKYPYREESWQLSSHDVESLPQCNQRAYLRVLLYQHNSI